MSTPERTTIQTFLEALRTALADQLIADPPTPAAPFRAVPWGPAEPESHPRPFLTLWPADVEPLGVIDDDKVLRVELRCAAVVDIRTEAAAPTLLDAAAAVDDCLDGLRPTLLAEGADGLDDHTWTFAYPKTAAGARVGTATATLTFVARVERSHNRLPAIQEDTP